MTSNEAVFVNNERFMKGRMSYDFNILTCLKVCIDEHASDLWKTHSNLTIITGDYFKCTGGVSSPDPCIVFYCLSKGFIPIDEEPFPTELTFRMGTLKTDVREGYFTLGPTTMRGYPDSFNDPICMGSNIGNQCRDASGSLGLFVDLPNNGKGFLTCCHVLFDCVKPREFSYSHIYDNEVQHVIQPGKSAFCSNTDTACGEILQAKFCPGRSPVSVDAALVKVNRRIPLTGHFVIKTVPQVKEIGYDLDALPVFDTGRARRKISKHDLEKPLLKSGTSSGLNRSLFRLDGAQVRIIEEGAWLGMDEQLPITMKGQYEVESGSKEPGSLNKPFFIPGDSGSAVFAKENDGTLTCIGIAIGITSYGTTVVTPIGAVLDALNLKDTDVTTFS
ncbi:hypothetical protein FSP39_005305 [Pinctada imbricata]|uniref:Peptidase S1 domain-containing protein n=1 Tax=Pinctada imbricata TaxID=66713 RepID=A0AA88YT48_PINIB|nr:hypothetical protein FSP39_005305 [Pinctada imbricata]